MTAESWIWVGAIGGAVIGCLGGVYGSIRSVRATRGPLERAYIIRVSVAMWLFILAFLGLMFLFPTPYRFFLWIPYGILLPIGIIRVNRRQMEIRQREGEASCAAE